MKRWNAMPEQKAKQTERMRKWREANPGYAKKQRAITPKKPRTAEQRARSAESTRKWREANAARYAEIQKRYRERNPLRSKLVKYKLSEDDFSDMLQRQNYTCATCPEPISGRGKGTHIDHDHTTGRVRGVLCYGCNHALGNVKDNPETLERLATYLRFDRN